MEKKTIAARPGDPIGCGRDQHQSADRSETECEQIRRLPPIATNPGRDDDETDDGDATTTYQTGGLTNRRSSITMILPGLSPTSVRGTDRLA